MNKYTISKKKAKWIIGNALQNGMVSPEYKISRFFKWEVSTYSFHGFNRNSTCIACFEADKVCSYGNYDINILINEEISKEQMESKEDVFYVNIVCIDNTDAKEYCIKEVE